MGKLPRLQIRADRPDQRWRLWGAMVLAALACVVLGVLLATTWADHSVDRLEHERIDVLRSENDTLKERVIVLERSEMIAKTALTEVQQTLSARAEEIDTLRADLAFYGRLVGGQQREGLAVHSIRIRPVSESSAWNFDVTLTQNFKRGQQTRGQLKLTVEGVEDEKLRSLDWAALTQSPSANGIAYDFRYFEQVSGTIMIPKGFEPNRIRVHAQGEGGRASHEFSWGDALQGEERIDVEQEET